MSLVLLFLSFSPSFTQDLESGVTTSVSVTYGPDDRVLYTVYAVNQPAIDVLRRVAGKLDKTREVLSDAGLAQDRAASLVRVNLQQRSFNEVVDWVAGAANLIAEVEPTRVLLRTLPDTNDSRAFESLLDRTLHGYRTVLRRHSPMEETPEIFLTTANLQFDAERWHMAINDYDYVLQFPGHPGVPEALLKCALAAEKVEDYGLARSRLLTLTKDFADYPRLGEAYLVLARLYGLLGDDGTSRTMIREAIRTVAPSVQSAELHIDAGELFFSTSLYGDAYRVAKGVRKLPLEDKALERALRLEFHCLYEMQHDEDALDVAKLYMNKFSRHPNSPPLLLDLARVHIRTGTPEFALMALRYLELAAVKDLDSVEYTYVKAQANDALGLSQEAIDGYTRVSETGDREERLWAGERLGALHHERRDYQKAIKAYDRFRRSGGSVTKSLFGITRSWLAQDEPQRASEVAELLLQEPLTKQEKLEALKLLGESYQAAGRFEDAARVLAGEYGGDS